MENSIGLLNSGNDWKDYLEGVTAETEKDK